MRELKFRAWDKTYKRMEEVDGIRFQGDTAVAICGARFCREIMQYTGLKDMNGKEVYEGDLLRGEDGPPFEVVYHNGSFKLQWSFEMSDGRIERSYTGIDAMSLLLTVVGNVYQNPELVQVKQ